jgi:hypothetical protein
MKATIHDSSFIRSLRPLDIAGYLAAKGWQRVRDRVGIAQLWQMGSDYEVLLPLDPRMDSFVVRMMELLKTVERVEQRDQPALIDDIQAGSADTIRVGIDDQDVADGTIAIAAGDALVSSARQMTWAAACSAARPRAAYKRRRPPEANDYLKKVRLAHGEVGSFIVRLLSPVPPTSRIGASSDGSELIAPPPFARQATETLASGLDAAKRIAAEQFGKGEVTNFDRYVHQGLSSNLCKALSDSRKYFGKSFSLKVSISWSWRRPSTSQSPSSFEFNNDNLEVLKETGRLFESFEPQEEFELFGTVVRLERGEAEPIGEATVRAYVDGGYKLVRFDLHPTDFQIATTALDKRDLISCLGELVKDGKSLRLKEPRAFRIVTEIEDGK